MSDVQGRLAQLDKRLTGLLQRVAAVLKDPRQANIIKLDPALASLQTRITTLLNRQALQHPGELVVMKSSQLSGLQDLVSVLRSLGFVLPLLTLLLYLGAIYLAKGWRREALMAAGGGILGATLLTLLARRLLGSAVTDSVASSDAVKPAISAVWNIFSAGLRQRALFVLVIGLGFIVGGLLAGPGRHEVAVRRFLAPYLRDRPVVVYAVVAFVFLVWLSFLPTINRSRSGPRGPHSRCARRGGHRDPAPADGTGVSAHPSGSRPNAAPVTGSRQYLAGVEALRAGAGIASISSWDC